MRSEPCVCSENGSHDTCIPNQFARVCLCEPGAVLARTSSQHRCAHVWMVSASALMFRRDSVQIVRAGHGQPERVSAHSCHHDVLCVTTYPLISPNSIALLWSSHRQSASSSDLRPRLRGAGAGDSALWTVVSRGRATSSYPRPCLRGSGRDAAAVGRCGTANWGGERKGMHLSTCGCAHGGI